MSEDISNETKAENRQLAKDSRLAMNDAQCTSESLSREVSNPADKALSVLKYRVGATVVEGFEIFVVFLLFDYTFRLSKLTFTSRRMKSWRSVNNGSKTRRVCCQAEQWDEQYHTMFNH